MNANTALLPAATAGTEITRFNAVKPGILSRHAVLPWEDADEYAALAASLVADDRGTSGRGTGGDLLAQTASAHRRGLEHAAKRSDTVKTALAHLDGGEQAQAEGVVVKAICATPEETAEEMRDLEEAESMTNDALAILDAGTPKACEQAVAALGADLRESWDRLLSRDPKGREPATPDPDGLRRFIETILQPLYTRRRMEPENRPSIRAQAFGQSLDPDKLMKLARYEVHLDRKLERTLTMLLRLQNLRRETTMPSSVLH